jgi:hypothetical protein
MLQRDAPTSSHTAIGPMIDILFLRLGMDLVDCTSRQLEPVTQHLNESSALLLRGAGFSTLSSLMDRIIHRLKPISILSTEEGSRRYVRYECVTFATTVMSSESSFWLDLSNSSA